MKGAQKIGAEYEERDEETDQEVFGVHGVLLLGAKSKSLTVQALKLVSAWSDKTQSADVIQARSSQPHSADSAAQPAEPQQILPLFRRGARKKKSQEVRATPLRGPPGV